MKNHAKFIIVLSVALMLQFVLFSYAGAAAAGQDTVFSAALVAHAGGGINGLTYTNSLEALNVNYEKGFRFFEVDIDITSDNKLALIHGWSYAKNMFNQPAKVYSLEEFKQFKMIGGLTQLSFADLAVWMADHTDACIVTDVKSDNIKALSIIANDHADLLHRIIPQVFTFYEYFPVKKMGYDKIILSLYKTKYSDANIVSFTSSVPVFAVTMSWNRSFMGLPSKLRKNGVFVYAYTVNIPDMRKALQLMGVNGLYTDFLSD